MKNKFTKLVCTACILAFTHTTAFSSEQRTVLFTPAPPQKVYELLPDVAFKGTIGINDSETEMRRRLRVVGGIKMPSPFHRRGESNFRKSEYLIDDNLDSVNVYRDTYSLYFKGENDDFDRFAHYRVSDIKGGKYTLSFAAKKKNLSIANAENFSVRLEIYYKQQGRFKDQIFDTPDSILTIPVDGGNSSFKIIKKDLELSDRVACVVIRMGGRNFSGECWFEAPKLTREGVDFVDTPFTFNAKRKSDYNYWVGTNLCTRSWPRWRLAIDGKTVYEGNIFDRASDIADFFIPIPAQVKQGSEFTLTLVKEPIRHARLYELRSIELIEETARPFEWVSIPKYAKVGDKFGLLIEINKPGTTVSIKCDKNVKPNFDSQTFNSTGLQVLEFEALTPGVGINIELSDGARTEKRVIEQAVVKDEINPVYLSVGDDIYVNKSFEEYNPFFKWYFGQRVGNWLQLRPDYQWCGIRQWPQETLNHYISMLVKMNVPYAWQTDGRTLAAVNVNPSMEQLWSPMFRGKQAHEIDGAYSYWGHNVYTGLHTDMITRVRPRSGLRTPIVFTENGHSLYRATNDVTDMVDGAKKLVERVRNTRYENTRHTGPSTNFRYFLQAGYQWMGAEQMYGPEETVMSSLRGASRAYGKNRYGSLHAMQWGSGPFTDPKHSLRLYLSLATAYMHGSCELNTEDALWLDEYANDRYSQSGKEHMEAQHRILDFIETHSRRGELTSNIAFIQGRNCAWKLFGRGNLWAQKGDKWKFNKAVESFDLLKIFYPENTISGCGPDGWFTHTPYGTVDVLPIEAPVVEMNRYKALVFLGWNSFDENDFKRLKSYVEKGGTIMLTAAHLNSEVQPNFPTQFPESDGIIRTLLGDDYLNYKTKQIIELGKGKIIYYPQHCYAIEDEIRADYESTIREMADTYIQEEREKGWISASESAVSFTVWDNGNTRTLYLLNVDWQGKQLVHQAKLNLKAYSFDIDVHSYQLETIHSNGEFALQPSAQTTDIIAIDKKDGKTQVSIQTTDKDAVKVYNGLTGEEKIIHLEKGGIHSVQL